MTRLLGYILTIYVLMCIVVPCTMVDDCEDEMVVVQGSTDKEEKECGNCTPFSICSSTHGFIPEHLDTTLAPVEFASPSFFVDYYTSLKHNYYSSLFRPPKVFC